LSLQSDLAKYELWLSLAIILTAISTLVPVLVTQKQRPDAPFRWAVGDPRLPYFLIIGSIIVSHSLTMLACAAKRRGRLQRVDLEIMGVLSALHVMWAAILGSRWVTALTHEMTPEEVWGDNVESDDSEPTCVVYLIIVVASVCQVLPIRTHVVWVVPAAGAITYPVVVACVGSLMPVAVRRFSLSIFIMCCIAHLGARRYERQMRIRWRAVRDAAERENVARGLEAMSWLSCDVIVRLDAQGCVLEPNTRRDSFFGRAMEGQRFEDLVDAADRDIFCRALARARESAELQSVPAVFGLSFATLRTQLAIVAIGGASTCALVGVSQVEQTPNRELKLVELDAIQEEAEAHIGAEGARDTEADIEVDRVSTATSTATDRVFNDINQLCSRWTGRDVSSSMRAALEHVAKIGVREHWLVATRDIEVLKPPVICGRGGFGCVAVGLFHGSPVAIKVPRGAASRNTAESVASFCNEIRLFRRVRHSHIVALHGAAIDANSGELALILEFVEGSSLGAFVSQLHAERAEGRTDLTLPKLLLDISGALRYLHELEPTVVHGDVKPSNIKVHLSGRGAAHAKLLDFGLSRLLAKGAEPLGGTRLWMAPELLANRSIRPSPSADVFSFGLLVYFVMTGESVEASFNAAAPASHGRFSRLAWPAGSLMLEQARSLCRDLLHAQPISRPQMGDVMLTLRGWVESSGVGFSGMGTSLRCMCSPTAPWEEGMQRLRQVMSRPAAQKPTPATAHTTSL